MKQHVLLFIGSFLLLSAVFFIFEIRIFDGIVIYDLNGFDQQVPSKLSLSYFIGLGYDQEEISHVKQFYLVTAGYANAFLILVGIPLFVAYRFYLSKKNRQK